MAYRVGANQGPVSHPAISGLEVGYAQPAPAPQIGPDDSAKQTHSGSVDIVQEAINSPSTVHPAHPILTGALNTSEVPDEISALRSSKLPLAVKALVAGGGLLASFAFARSTLLSSPDNIFGGILIGLVALLTLPIIGAEFTNRRLVQEFELLPLNPRHLPTIDKILDKGYTAEQFGNFVEQDLLPRVPIGHFRTMANESGTCLHDIRHWAHGEQHFPGTSWETVHKIIEDLGVGDDISQRVKAALLIIERDTTLNEASLPDINAALSELAD